MNVHESEKIAGILRRVGYTEETKNKEDAEIRIFCYLYYAYKEITAVL